MKISAGITIFNPKKEDIKNINEIYSSFFDKVYIYNNSKKMMYEFKENIFFVSEGVNDGLGIACDCLCNIAKKDGFDYIMLFDQDSRISQENLTNIVKFIEKKEVEAAIYSPQIIYNDNTKVDKKGYKYIDWCITSGSVIDLHMYGDKYKFDINYFIDRLDRDLCKQVVNSNKKICQVNSSVLLQQLGEKSKKGKTMHSANRHYYISRNRLYYNNKYKVKWLITIMQVLKHIVRVIINENDKIEKIKMINKGINDYKKDRMGKLVL